MSISSAATRKAGPFSGNGSTTAFPFTFKVFQASDVLVVQTDTTPTDTTLVLNTDYTVSLNANQDSNPGGTVNMVVAPPSGYLLTLGSQVQQVQSVTLTNTGGFYPTVINTALDYLTILIQQIAEKVGRSLILPFSTGANVSAQLPPVAPGQLIGWKADGTGIANMGASGTGSSDMLNTLTVAGTANAITCTTSSAIALSSNQFLWITPTSKNTGPVTINRDNLGAKNVHLNGAALVGGEFQTGVPVLLEYDGTQYNIFANNAAVTAFTQSGTGAVSRTIEQELRERVSVTQFGAKVDGVTDDSAAWQAANAHLVTLGGGVITCGPGTSIANFTIDPYVSILGAGDGVTIIKSKAASGKDVIQTTGFASLTGTTSTGGSFKNVIRGITVDGNKASNSAGYGIRLYGKAFRLEDVSTQNCVNDGIYTEYAGADNFSTPSGTLEAHLRNVISLLNGGHGWNNNGPHDSVVVDMQAFNNGGWGYYGNTNSAITISGINTYLNTLGGIYSKTTILGSGVIGSTATGVGLELDTPGGGHIIDGIFSGPTGINLITAGATKISGTVSNTTVAGVVMPTGGTQKLDLQMFSNSGNWFSLPASPGYADVKVANTDGIGTIFSGTPNGIWSIGGTTNYYFHANAAGFTGLQVGNGATTNAGLIAGNLSSGYGAIWPTAVTPSVANYAFNSNGTTTNINGGTYVYLNVANNNLVQVAAAGIAVYGYAKVFGALWSADPAGGVGYQTGAGGAVTQLTSRTTGVTLNKVTGQITLVSAPGSASWQSFTVTNSTVAATDTIRVNQASGADLYQIHVTHVAAGSFQISFATTGGTTTEQPVFNFSVIKGVAA